MNSYLIISTELLEMDKHGNKKLPGIRLCKWLRDKNVFGLLPVTTFGKSIFRMSVFILFIRNLKDVYSSSKKGNIYFYNFPPIYLVYYFVYFFSTRSRPALFCADGEHVFLYSLKHLFFRKVISSAFVADDTNNKWFPGALNQGLKVRCSEGFNNKILFNSTLKKNNGYHLLLSIAKNNPDLIFQITCSKHDYLNAISKVSDCYPCKLPENIDFLSELDYEEYKCVLSSCGAVLLIRDEGIRANQLNFPSKLIEALEYNKPLISVYPISGIPIECYLLADDFKFFANNMNHSYENVDLIRLYDYLLDHCSTSKLKKYVDEC